MRSTEDRRIDVTSESNGLVYAFKEPEANLHIDKRSGTQSIEKAILILKELAGHPNFGWRVSDLAKKCELDKATAHRILQTLKANRLVAQKNQDKRYQVGPLIYELSLGLNDFKNFELHTKKSAEALARKTKTVVFYMLQSGFDFTCMARFGNAPTQLMMFEVGTRKPLMMSAGGVAMLMAMPPPQCKRVMAENRLRLKKLNIPSKGIEQMWKDSHKVKRAINAGATVPGWVSYAMPFCNFNGEVIGSVMMSAQEDRIAHHSSDFLFELLSKEANEAANMYQQFFQSKLEN